MNQLRTPMQPLNFQNIDLNGSVVINDRRGEHYHMVTGATKPLHRQSSNKTTTTPNEHPFHTTKSFPQNTQNATRIN